jgi:hypothetical protein
MRTNAILHRSLSRTAENAIYLNVSLMVFRLSSTKEFVRLTKLPELWKQREFEDELGDFERSALAMLNHRCLHLTEGIECLYNTFDAGKDVSASEDLVSKWIDRSKWKILREA